MVMSFGMAGYHSPVHVNVDSIASSSSSASTAPTSLTSLHISPDDYHPPARLSNSSPSTSSTSFRTASSSRSGSGPGSGSNGVVTMFPGFLASPETDPSPPSPSSPSSGSPPGKIPLPSHSHYIANSDRSPNRFLSTSPSAILSGPSLPRATPKKRPTPLDFKGKGVQIEQHGGQQTCKSVLSDAGSTLSTEMEDLSLLRQSVRRNLRERPLVSPLPGSDSDPTSSGTNTPSLPPTNTSLPEHETLPIGDALKLLRSSPQVIVIDTRPLDDFFETHLPQSAHLSIPSLIMKRMRKQTKWSGGWKELAAFVSTPAGRRTWNRIDLEKRLDVVIVSITGEEEVARILKGMVEGLIKDGTVRVLRGGWKVAVMSPGIRDQLVTGENDQTQTQTITLSPPRSAPAYDTPPIPPPLNHHPSMPSLRPEHMAKRNLPSLSINPSSSTRKTPKLSLNLDRPLRSATLDVPSSYGQPRSPIPTSQTFQSLCHEQSKLPPSSRSFGDVTETINDDSPRTPWTANVTARPYQSSTSAGVYPTPESPEATTSIPDTLTARGSVPFIVSIILPSFLYLGPEIATKADVEALHRLGIKRILNVAFECDDNESLGIRDSFEKYLRIPMKDTVEESGVGRGIREACDFLDDARLHSSPTYVHCRAGKSRSVTVVLAYLIHANAWTLKTSYAYVAERRKGISPNIGFVAELMQYEEAELGLKQSGGVHGESTRGDDDEEDGRGNVNGGGENSAGGGNGGGRTSHPRYMRESLPPAWNSLDTRPPKVSLIGDMDNEADGPGHGDEMRHQAAEEREVRKNGQWVHSRRAPVDRTTLQPGRRVSKAGLESMRALSSASPRPISREDKREASHTPSGEGRLNWV